MENVFSENLQTQQWDAMPLMENVVQWNSGLWNTNRNWLLLQSITNVIAHWWQRLCTERKMIDSSFASFDEEMRHRNSNFVWQKCLQVLSHNITFIVSTADILTLLILKMHRRLHCSIHNLSMWGIYHNKKNLVEDSEWKQVETNS